MALISFALSIHNLAGSAGDDAGFAAIFGLAVLALLYFAQARETKTLRESLKRADEELGGLHERLNTVIAAQAAAAQRAAAPAPVPPPVVRPMGSAVASIRQGLGVAALAAPVAARAATQSLSALELPPSAPVGVGAPALSSATKLVPTAVPSSAKAGPEAPVLAGAAATLPPDVTVIGGLAPATAAGGNGNAGQPPVGAPTPVSVPTPVSAPTPVSVPTPVSATALGAGVGVAAGAAAGAVAAGAASQTAPPFDLERSTAPPPPPPVSADAPASRPREPVRPPAARGKAAAAGRGRPRRPRSRAARIAPWLIGLAALGVAIAALVIITGDNSPATTTSAGKTTAQSHTGTTTTSHRHHSKGAAFDPSGVTVAVLNGTDTNNLAHNTGLRLAGFGYTEGTIATAASQTQTTTAVGYTPGHKADALHVAQALKLKSSAVTPVDQDTLAVACPQPAPCTADVVVTIGQDLVTAQTSTT